MLCLLGSIHFVSQASLIKNIFSSFLPVLGVVLSSRGWPENE
jgi:hypothetical protein